MRKKPYISFIVPCYNASAFIKQCVSSVTQQPYDNWELIIINDGSTDNSAEIVEKLALSDRRIHLINTNNMGAGHARNTGIKAAAGEWTMFLDADDLYLEGSINHKLIGILEEYESDYDIVYTSVVIGTDINLKDNIRLYKPEKIYEIKYRPYMAFWNGIYKTSYLKKDNIRFFEYKEQDVETAFRYIVYNETKRKIAREDIAFYLQRNNPYSNTHTWDLEQLLFIKSLVYGELFRKYKCFDNSDYLFEEVVEEIHQYYRNTILSKYKDNEHITRINQLHKLIIHEKENRCVTKKGKKHLQTNRIFWLLANISPLKKPKRKTNGENSKLIVDSTESVMGRLFFVSKFVQNCLLG